MAQKLPQDPLGPTLAEILEGKPDPLHLRTEPRQELQSVQDRVRRQGPRIESDADYLYYHGRYPWE